MVAHTEGERRLRVFENKVLRRIFGPKRDEVTAECRQIHNEEHDDLYSSPNITRVIKPRRVRRAGYVARMGENCIEGKRDRKRQLGITGVDGRIKLSWIFRKWDEGAWT